MGTEMAAAADQGSGTARRWRSAVPRALVGLAQALSATRRPARTSSRRSATSTTPGLGLDPQRQVAGGRGEVADRLCGSALGLGRQRSPRRARRVWATRSSAALAAIRTSPPLEISSSRSASSSARASIIIAPRSVRMRVASSRSCERTARSASSLVSVAIEASCSRAFDDGRSDFALDGAGALLHARPGRLGAAGDRLSGRFGERGHRRLGAAEDLVEAALDLGTALVELLLGPDGTLVDLRRTLLELAPGLGRALVDPDGALLELTSGVGDLGGRLRAQRLDLLAECDELAVAQLVDLASCLLEQLARTQVQAGLGGLDALLAFLAGKLEFVAARLLRQRRFDVLVDLGARCLGARSAARRAASRPAARSAVRPLSVPPQRRARPGRRRTPSGACRWSPRSGRRRLRASPRRHRPRCGAWWRRPLPRR